MDRRAAIALGMVAATAALLRVLPPLYGAVYVFCVAVRSALGLGM